MAANVVAPASNSCGTDVPRTLSSKVRSIQLLGGGGAMVAVGWSSICGAPGLPLTDGKAHASIAASPHDRMRLTGLNVDEAHGRLLAWGNQHPVPRRTGECCKHQPLGKTGAPARAERRLVHPVDFAGLGVEVLHLSVEILGR